MTYSTQDIFDQFANAKSWPLQMKILLELAKQPNDFAQIYKTPEHLIPGCEVPAWVIHVDRQWLGFSDSKITAGLIFLVLQSYNQCTHKHNWSIEETLESHGLSRFLSQSRMSGMNSLGKILKEKAP